MEEDSLIFTVCIEGTYEIKMWILGWGSGAVCLEPEKLKEEIRLEILDLLTKYDEIQK